MYGITEQEFADLENEINMTIDCLWSGYDREACEHSEAIGKILDAIEDRGKVK